MKRVQYTIAVIEKMLPEKGREPEGIECGYVQSSNHYKAFLERRGHSVNIGSEIAELPQPLDRYDLAIAHPHFPDVKMLYEEIKKRREFRVILTTCDPLEYGSALVLESEQVCSFYAIFKERRRKIISLIEKGWGKGAILDPK